MSDTMQEEGNLAVYRAAASILLDRLKFAQQAGITFNGSRDLYEILGYDRVITSKQYRDEYARGGIAKRIVEAYPKATWRGGVELYEDEDPDVSTPFEDAWHALETQLNVWARLQQVDILAGLSTYAVLLIGAPGSDFSQEMPKGKPGQLLYLSPFAGGGGPSTKASTSGDVVYIDATIQTFEEDARNPRFGLPKTYMLKRLDVNSPMLTQPVHWSRVIHVAEGTLDNDVYGTPTLENVWNLLADLEKVTGGGSEAFWLRANAGLQLDVDKDMALPPDPAELAKLREDVEDYKHNITRILRTRGVAINQLGSDVANFTGPTDAIIKQIAGSKGIPMRILTGSEMGQLASGQDADNWRMAVQDRRTSYAGPMIVRRLVDRLIDYGYLPKPSKYEVGWPVVETMTELEKADGAKAWAAVNQAAGMTIFTASEIREKWFDMEEPEDLTTEAWRADLAVKMATANKTEGAVIFTNDEIRKTSYNWDPLKPEEKVPLTAPERVSATAPTPEVDQNGNAKPVQTDLYTGLPKAHAPTPVINPPLPVMKAAEAELLEVLTEAIAANNTEVIDKILGLTR